MTEAAHSNIKFEAEKNEKTQIDLRTNVVLSEDDLYEEAKTQFSYHTAILNVMHLNARSVLGGNHLSPIGRHLYCITLEKNYANCKRVLNYIATHPELKMNAKPMPPPLVIIGLPRTGSTLLYNLLACDPMCRAPLLADMVEPIPPIARSDTAGQQKRQIAIRAFSEMMDSLGLSDYKKEICASHPRLAYEEDNRILNHVGFDWFNYFLAPRNNTELVQWFFDESSKDYIYKYHKTFLQMLNHVDTPHSHWLLKALTHTIFLDPFLQHYPSALLIMTHRRIDEALPSLMRLARAFTSAYLDSEKEDAADNLKQVDKNCLDSLVVFGDRMVEFRRVHPDFPIFDIFYDELTAQPIDTVRRIYDHFGLTWSEEFELAMRTWLRENPQGKQGRLTYSLEEFGLTCEEIEQRFKEYINMFLLPRKILKTDQNITKASEKTNVESK